MKPAFHKVYREPKPKERESDMGCLVRELPRICHLFVQTYGAEKAALAGALSGVDILGEARKFKRKKT